MVRICCAFNCGLTQTKDCTISFHRFPLEDKELRRKWVRATKLDNFTPVEDTRVCQQHFRDDDFMFSSSKKPKPGAVPSVFNFPKHISPSTGSKRKAPTPRDEFVTPVKKGKMDCASDQTPLQPTKRWSPSKLDLKKKIKVLQQQAI